MATGTAALALPSPDLVVEADRGVFTEFELDVQVTTDLESGYSPRRCTTNDGCAGSCASACTSA
jgi:FxLD family lantipeptide